MSNQRVELPALDVTEEDRRISLRILGEPVAAEYRARVSCRERQLLEVLSQRADLLEALKGMRKRWGKNNYCSDPECNVCAEEIAITNASDAAIAKAEGRLHTPTKYPSRCRTAACDVLPTLRQPTRNRHR